MAAELEKAAYDPTADMAEAFANAREHLDAAEASTQAKDYRIDPEKTYPEPDYLFEAGACVSCRAAIWRLSRPSRKAERRCFVAFWPRLFSVVKCLALRG